MNTRAYSRTTTLFACVLCLSLLTNCAAAPQGNADGYAGDDTLKQRLVDLQSNAVSALKYWQQQSSAAITAQSRAETFSCRPTSCSVDPTLCNTLNTLGAPVTDQFFSYIASTLIPPYDLNSIIGPNNTNAASVGASDVWAYLHNQGTLLENNIQAATVAGLPGAPPARALCCWLFM